MATILTNSRWQSSGSSGAILNCTPVFMYPENICLDNKISIECHINTEIMIELGFYTAAIFTIKFGRQ